MNKSRRKWNIVLAGLLSVFLLSSCGAKQEEAGTGDDKKNQTKLTFVLDWTPNTNHTGIYVAKNQGYFKEVGLDVEIVQPPEDGAEVLVGSGNAEFGVSFQDSMVPALTGEDALPIEAVAAVLQHNTSGIISRQGEGMDRPRGLEGKKYATWDMDLEKAVVKDVMAADGADFAKVELIPNTVTDEVSALENKAVDAIWVFYGWAGIKTEAAGLRIDYFAFADIAPELDFYTPVIIGNTDWMKENPETAKAFLGAVKKGYEYAIENPDAAADILCKEVPELDPELVKASQDYMKDEYQADAKSWGYIDPARWNAFYNWVNEKELSPEKLSEDVGFTNDYLE